MEELQYNSKKNLLLLYRVWSFFICNYSAPQKKQQISAESLHFKLIYCFFQRQARRETPLTAAVRNA